MALGLLLAGVGMDTVSGQLRMTFGSSELLRGINFLVAVIGLFGISEILAHHGGAPRPARATPPPSACVVVLSVREGPAEIPGDAAPLICDRLLARHHAGRGDRSFSFMGYNLAKRFSKDPDSFGKGRIDGVFAPETAAHPPAPRRSCSAG